MRPTRSGSPSSPWPKHGVRSRLLPCYPSSADSATPVSCEGSANSTARNPSLSAGAGGNLNSRTAEFFVPDTSWARQCSVSACTHYLGSSRRADGRTSEESLTAATVKPHAALRLAVKRQWPALGARSHRASGAKRHASTRHTAMPAHGIRQRRKPHPPKAACRNT